MAPDGPEPRFELSTEQRARLRATVDLDALERLLGRVPAPMHAMVLLFCARAPTAADWEAAVATLQEHGGEPVDEPDEEPPGMPRIVQDLRFNDPELNALWRAVEPDRAA